jgi:hypothetical protein
MIDGHNGHNSTCCIHVLFFISADNILGRIFHADCPRRSGLVVIQTPIVCISHDVLTRIATVDDCP